MATELLAHTLAPTCSSSERCVSHIPIFGRENICEKNKLEVTNFRRSCILVSLLLRFASRLKLLLTFSLFCFPFVGFLGGNDLDSYFPQLAFWANLGNLATQEPFPPRKKRNQTFRLLYLLSFKKTQRRFLVCWVPPTF